MEGPEHHPEHHPEHKNPEKGHKPEGIEKPKGDSDSLAPAPALIIVTLPADAKLAIEGQATSTTSSVRSFESPVLRPGKDFHYQLEAKFVRDGQTVTVSKRIAVRAGQETRVELNAPVSVAQK
jgi:uncharacterized protein (TIGR03000 family)